MDTPQPPADVPAPAPGLRSAFRSVPWQIRVAIVALALEGVGNLFAIADNATAVVWLAAKCLFITGFLRRWSYVYVLFLVVAALHVVGFARQAPFVAFLNLVLIGLVGSVFRFYDPDDNGRRDQL